MFGKVSARYYKSNSAYGPVLFTLAILFVLIFMTIVGVYSGVIKLGDSADQARYSKLLSEYLKDQCGISFDSTEYVGITYENPIPYSSYYHKHEFVVYGIKGMVDRTVKDDTIILYVEEDGGDKACKAYSVGYHKKL